MVRFWGTGKSFSSNILPRKITPTLSALFGLASAIIKPSSSKPQKRRIIKQV
jgi:hypothetical protein